MAAADAGNPRLAAADAGSPRPDRQPQPEGVNLPEEIQAVLRSLKLPAGQSAHYLARHDMT